MAEQMTRVSPQLCRRPCQAGQQGGACPEVPESQKHKALLHENNLWPLGLHTLTSWPEAERQGQGQAMPSSSSRERLQADLQVQCAQLQKIHCPAGHKIDIRLAVTVAQSPHGTNEKVHITDSGDQANTRVQLSYPTCQT